MQKAPSKNLKDLISASGEGTCIIPGNGNSSYNFALQETDTRLSIIKTTS